MINTLRFEIRIGIVAACIPTLRPGYKWLRDKISSARSSQEHRKLSDEIQLKAINEAFSAQGPERPETAKYGNSVSIDVERGHQESLEDRIRKFSTVAVHYT